MFQHGTNTRCQPTIMDPLKIEELDKMFMFNVPARPQNVFSVRVTVLRDATMLCFGISHHLADGTASYQVIKTFCDLLSGRSIPSLVLPPDARGIRMSETMIEDERCSDIHYVDYDRHRENFTAGFFPILKVVIGILWNKILRLFGLRQPLQEKFIYVPGDWVGSTRKRALQELSSRTGYQQRQTSEPSKNDIINAWYLKTLFSPMPQSSEPVDFYGPLNYRFALQKPQEGTYWVHNSIGLLREKLSIGQIQSESIATLASKLRQTTLQYTKVSSIKEYLRFCEDHAQRRLPPNIRGSGNMPMLMVTSWTGFDFSALEFSAASCEKGQIAKVTFLNPIVRNMRDGVWPCAFTLKSVDGGGYWLRASNTQAGWENFDKSGDVGNLFIHQ
jgi:hypothetical protein